MHIEGTELYMVILTSRHAIHRRWIIKEIIKSNKRLVCCILYEIPFKSFYICYIFLKESGLPPSSVEHWKHYPLSERKTAGHCEMRIHERPQGLMKGPKLIR